MTTSQHQTRSHIATTRRDIAAEITATILAHLDAGVLPWRKPWDGARTAVVRPRRCNGETYRGVNIILLWSASIARGYASPSWLTLKQANQHGASIRTGERGECVVYYGNGSKLRTGDNGEHVEDNFRFLKHYTAFNADQIDGLPPEFHPEPLSAGNMPLPAHEAWFEQLGATPHRVGRDMGKRFSKHGIAAEELVAEIGASILGAHLQLPPHHIHDHASYIGHWMKFLLDDKRAVLAAAAQAQTAVDWLLAKSPLPGEPQMLAKKIDVAA